MQYWHNVCLPAYPEATSQSVLALPRALGPGRLRQRTGAITTSKLRQVH
jgi:hypothetical protein